MVAAGAGGRGERGVLTLGPAPLDLAQVYEACEQLSDLDLHLKCLRYRVIAKLALPSSATLTSGKAQAIAKLLPELRTEGHRTLIFSQWTMVLDVLGLLLDHLGYEWRRLDGSTDVGERQRIIDEFNGDPSIDVCLLTTRAGGLGINLTSADTVILHDADFNPAADRQAMDRAHRMGQMRPVRVIRMASAGTVDGTRARARVCVCVYVRRERRPPVASAASRALGRGPTLPPPPSRSQWASLAASAPLSVPAHPSE